MTREENIRRYTKAELREMRARGGSRTDLARIDAKTEADIERDIASDPDWADIPRDWYKDAVAVPAKKLISLRLDAEVVDWFRRQGPGYQTRMNDVLRSYATRRAKAKKAVASD